MEDYKKRIADMLLEERLDAFGAVLVEGPKACGKSTTAMQQAGSILKMDDPKKKNHYLELANTDISVLLEGKTPRLIDEWQVAPKFWDAIRFEVDERRKDGQFILTGSAVPPIAQEQSGEEGSEITHTGTGRFARVRMRPMSLYESGESNGGISLDDLFQHVENLHAENTLNLQQIAFLTCRGGWPRALNKKTERAALLLSQEYIKSITQSDIFRVDGVSRDPERARLILRSYARHVGTQANAGTIAADLSANEGITISDDTIKSYLTALRKIFVIEDSSAWSPQLRSKTAIRTTDTRYFVDPSIATAAMHISPKDLMNDTRTFGFFFENLVIRDLRIYTDYWGGEVQHYRDKTGLECDAVVHMPNGEYALVEVKLGSDEGINEGVQSLTQLVSLIQKIGIRQPSFCMVLTAVGPYAYQREDGIYVIPIGCLKP